jgi:rhodanese-related sulfurtransferase
VALSLGLACAMLWSDTPTVTGDELEARLARGDAPAILDVRTRKEFAEGHIPGAINIPHTELSERIGELGSDARDQELVVYCRSGRRAAVAEEVLRDAGFSGLRHLEGDMNAWRKEQRPCEGC